MVGLFDIFTTAVRGMTVQQGNISTAAHNIANEKTEGYSRQRNTVHTTRPFGGMSRFDNCSVGQVGTGAEITEITRVRDSFLDYQYRDMTTEYGTSDVKNQYLTQVEDILNETSNTGIQKKLSEFSDAFQSLANDAKSTDKRTLAIGAASNLAKALNDRYNELENKKSDIQGNLQQYVSNMNSLLDDINSLNKQIKDVSASGMTPNDLMDSRDYDIDQLSSYYHVNVTRKDKETIDLSASEGTGLKNMVNANPNDTDYMRFSYVENAVPDVAGTSLTVTYDVLGDKNNKKTIVINDTATNIESLRKELMQDRILAGDKDGIVNCASSPSCVSPIDSDVNNMNTLISTYKSATPASVSSWPTQIKDSITNKVVSASQTVGGITTTVTFDNAGKITSVTEVNGTKTTAITYGTSGPESAEMTQTGIALVSPASGTETVNIKATAFDASGNIKAAQKTETPEASSTFSLSFSNMKTKVFNDTENGITKGQIAGSQVVEDDIDNYVDKINKFTASFAYAVNTIQTGSKTDGVSGITDVNGNPVATTEDIFVNSSLPGSQDTGINAGNITINSNMDVNKLKNDPGLLNCGAQHVDDVSGVKDGSRAQAIADLKNLKIDIGSLTSSDIDTRADFFKIPVGGSSSTAGIDFDTSGTVKNMNMKNTKSGTGSTVSDYYSSVVGILYNDSKTATTDAGTYKNKQSISENARLQVSGVSEDEEVANLVQYQHSYQANAKIISTVDELLDVVINGLKK